MRELQLNAHDEEVSGKGKEEADASEHRGGEGEKEEEEEEEAVFVCFLKPQANPFAPVPRRFRAHRTLRPWTYSRMRVVKCMCEENCEQRWSRLLRCCCCVLLLLSAARLSCCV